MLELVRGRTENIVGTEYHTVLGVNDPEGQRFKKGY